MKNYNLLILVTLFTTFSCGDDSTKNGPKTDIGNLDMGRDVEKDVKSKVDVRISDMSTDQNTSDILDTIDYGRTLKDYRTCKSDSDCPVGLGQCITQVQLNRLDKNGDDSVPVSTFIEGLEVDQGICTRICTLSDTECTGLSANGATPDAEPYVCQIVVVGEAPYPTTPPAFPFDITLTSQELEDGISFGAICRPPFQLDENVDRGFCADCVGGIACPGSAICWNSLLKSEALEGESGACFGRCSDDKPCPGGFSCEELGEQNYCRPILDSCSSCVDRDKDGRGNGRCGPQASPISNYDCDDYNADAYYDVGNPAHAFPDFCAESNDFNCNGISDAAEEVGSINFGNDHCTACFDECRGAVPNGTSECIADTCRADCTDDTKWADCDGDLTNGCEQAVDDPTRVYYRDQDHDGFGDPDDSIFACDPVNPPAGYVADNTDCNDVEISIHPGAVEICDGIDQDCNLIDDDNTVGLGQVCHNPGTLGLCENGGEIVCTDGIDVCDQKVMPIAEDCNGVDDNCDGQIDNDPVTGEHYCADLDRDLYGDCAKGTTVFCQHPGPDYRLYTPNTNYWDCADQNADIRPFRTEDCATVADDNCNGQVNDNDVGTRVNEKTFVLDADGDGYGIDDADQVTQCEAPAGYSVFKGFNDCMPNNANVNPGQAETCDTSDIDDNCNGDLHDALTGTTAYYLDNDGDLYGAAEVYLCDSVVPIGYSIVGGDCNDSVAPVTVASNGHAYSGVDQNPGKAEHCEGYDNNCDGTINDGCPLDMGLTNYRYRGIYAGLATGTPAIHSCPVGEVVIGLTINSVDQIGGCAINGGIWGVGIRCANPSVVEDNQNDPFTYSQPRGAVTSSPVIGGQSPYLGPTCDHLRSSKFLDCSNAAGTVTGLHGNQNSGVGLHRLGIDCKDHAISNPVLTNPTTITMNNPSASITLPANYIGGSYFAFACANNEVAVGIRSHFLGGRIKSIELRCADISAVNQ